MDADALEGKFRRASEVSLGIFIVGTCISVFLFFTGLQGSGAFQRDLCIKKSCIENFLDFIELSTAAFSTTISLTITAFTVLGIYFAVLNYIATAKTNAISNHLLNLNTFKDYLNDELKRKERVNKGSIDTFKWYNLVFPSSKTGQLTPGYKYELLLKKINDCIKYSNSEYSSSSTPSFEYKPHQRRIIEAMAAIGIKIEFMPRNDFKAAEKEIIDLINTTNQEFCGEQSLQKLTEPEYL
ncbi:retron Ec48 family effector membrane protein [Marinobacter sp. M3C]|uniref:retron Ec48 family effector membrane protein n=1 Tax=Marinobacter sp. M3C TaxID=2917715 RepID=UPI002010AB17|nr:retron Ec48 family effector membrane protein [Marinobacter sp. M3C]UQG59350.1 retron Ec48 family effector membrane protein [Marinobacter sp. M3C]